MRLFDSLEMKPGELPPAVVSRTAAAKWFPSLSTGQAAAVVLVALAWLVRSSLPLDAGAWWSQLGAGRIVAAQAASAGWQGGLAAARSVGPGWAGDLALYGAWAVAGSEGLALLGTALFTLSAALLLVALRLRGARWGLAATLSGAALVGVATALPSGAAAFGLLGLASLATLLAAGGRRPAVLWLTPALLCAWANLDASFVWGAAWLVAWGIGRAFEVRWEVAEIAASSGLPWPSGSLDPTPRGRSLGRTSRWSEPAVAVLGVAACAVQPQGFQGVVAAWRSVSEHAWQIAAAPGALSWFVSLLVATAVLARLSPRCVPLAEGLVVALAVVAALANANWLPLLAVAWVWAAAPHWQVLAARRGSEPSEPSATKTSIALAAVFLAIMWSPSSRFLLGAPPRPAGQMMTSGAPLALAAELEERGLAGKAFYSPGWADYLGWQSGGRLLPLVNDLVPRNQGVWRDAAAIGAANHGWLEIADHYQLRYLIVGRGESPELAGAVQREKRCRVLYQDQQGLLVELLPAPK